MTSSKRQLRKLLRRQKNNRVACHIIDRHMEIYGGFFLCVLQYGTVKLWFYVMLWGVQM